MKHSESTNSPFWNLLMASLNSGIADSRRFTKTLNPLSFLLPAAASASVEYGKKKHGSMLPSNLFDSGKTVTGPPHPKSTVECPKYRQSVNPVTPVPALIPSLWCSSWKSIKERTYSSLALDLLCFMISAVFQMG